MKKFSLFASAILMMAVISCNKEITPVVEPEIETEIEQALPSVQKMSFTAIADNGAETRTILDGQNVKWAAHETIYVFDGQAPRAFVSTNDAASDVVTFEGEAGQATTYYAVYPAATMSGSSFNVTIPVFQTATPNSFDPKANVSVAVSNTTLDNPAVLYFKNAGAVVKFQVRNTDITKVRLDAIGGQSLAGNATITLNDAIPTVSMASDAQSCVILTPQSGTFATNTDYAIAIAPGTYTGGFRITLFRADGSYKSFASTSELNLSRNDLMDFGAMPEVKNWKTGTTVTVFTETFLNTSGTGGHDGKFTGEIGLNTVVFDQQNIWESPYACGGANQCLKMGTSSDYGSLYTKSLSISGDAVLTFSAAGWGTGTNKLEVTVEGASATGVTDITLSNGEWNNYTVNLSNANGDVTITFYGKRGFLDDIKLEATQEGGPVDPTVDTPSLEITNITPQNLKVSATNGEASFDIDSNVPWTVSANQSFVTLSVTNNHVDVSFSNLAEGSRDVTITVDPSEGTPQTITFTQSVQKTQYTVSYSAAKNDFENHKTGEFYTKNSDNTVSNKWTFSGHNQFTGTGLSNGYLQLGKNGGAESLTFTTSAIPGTIKSIDIDCAAYQGKHTIQIKVGDNVLKTLDAPTWSNNSGGSVKWTGEATGSITILATAQSGARAFYLKTITVEYEQ